MYDLNDAQSQMLPTGELIPDGTFARVRLTIRPGGVNGTSPLDAGLLTASKSSDAKMLDCEFTVIAGPFARRKFWQNYTVAGGKLDDKGVSKGWNVSKAAFRAMVDSALGLDPKDMSDQAKTKRVLRALKDLEGISFVGRIMIEPASSAQYKDANKLANVVTPDEPQYAPVMRGETVPPDPIKAKPRKAAPAAQEAPAWTSAAVTPGPNPEPAWNPAPASATPAPAAQPAPPPAESPAAGPSWLNS